MSESRALTVPEAREMAEIFAASGMFADVKEMAQAFVKIQAGQEIGVQPFAAMTGIHIIKGKPTLGAGLIAGRIKGSAKYDYRVGTMSDTECHIAFYECGKEIGVSSFTMKDAQAADLTSNPSRAWQKFAKNMLFARAMSNGARWYCPDIFNGSVYTPEEMGADVEIIEGEAHVVVETPQPEPTAEPAWYDGKTKAVAAWLGKEYGITIDDLHSHEIHLRQFKTREDFIEYMATAGPAIAEMVKLETEEVVSRAGVLAELESSGVA